MTQSHDRKRDRDRKAKQRARIAAKAAWLNLAAR